MARCLDVLHHLVTTGEGSIANVALIDIGIILVSLTSLVFIAPTLLTFLFRLLLLLLVSLLLSLLLVVLGGCSCWSLFLVLLLILLLLLLLLLSTTSSLAFVLLPFLLVIVTPIEVLLIDFKLIRYDMLIASVYQMVALAARIQSSYRLRALRPAHN